MSFFIERTSKSCAVSNRRAGGLQATRNGDQPGEQDRAAQRASASQPRGSSRSRGGLDLEHGEERPRGTGSRGSPRRRARRARTRPAARAHAVGDRGLPGTGEVELARRARGRRRRPPAPALGLLLVGEPRDQDRRHHLWPGLWLQRDGDRLRPNPSRRREALRVAVPEGATPCASAGQPTPPCPAPAMTPPPRPGTAENRAIDGPGPRRR